MITALATCVIVVSGGMNGDINEKYWHEMAHCNGWVHPIKVSIVGEAYQPPKKYLHVYPGPIDYRQVSLSQAKRLCNGHYACQWFEEN